MFLRIKIRLQFYVAAKYSCKLFFCYNFAKYVESNFIILFSIIIRKDLSIKSVEAFATFQLCCHVTLS